MCGPRRRGGTLGHRDRKVSGFGLLAFGFSMKDEPGPRVEECRVVCGQREKKKKYEIAVLENRKMNFLGKAGRIARREECQFEVCGHEFKGQPVSGLHAFPGFVLQLEREEGWVLRGLGISQAPVVEGREQACWTSAREC